MADETLFGSDQTPVATDSANATPALPDNVKDLIGEGKKYASVEKALEALGHSQAHIARIEAENAEYRAKVESAVDSEKLYETVQELLKRERSTNPQANGAGEVDIERLLDRKLTEREQKQVADANASAVRQALVDKFGDKGKAQEMFEAKAKELGIGVEFFTDLAKKSPKAVLEYFGTKVNTSPPATRGTVNSEQLSTQPRESPRKSIMAGATSDELLAAWKASAPKTS